MSKYLKSLQKFDDFQKQELKDAKVNKALIIPSELNFDQALCFREMVDFVKFDNRKSILLLKGYAGTGKTYLIGKFIDYILNTRDNWNIAMTAPTNKAVKVLRKSSGIHNPMVNFSTIHSLLGLREQITENGDQIFVAGNTDTPNILNFKILIIDEVSMLPDELFTKVQGYANNVKIILLGDPAQIPPVMKHDCIPFTPEGRNEFDIKMIELTEIMRQKKGNAIIENSMIIRDNLEAIQPPIVRTISLNEDGKGIIHVNSSDEAQRDGFIETLQEYFTDDRFKENSDYAKVLSWTNKSVTQMNKLIRGMIFKDRIEPGAKMPKVMVGEKLIANKPIIKIDKLGKTIIFTSNDEFEVISYEVLTDSRFFFYYETVVEEVLIDGSRVRKNIKILHEDSEAEFNKKLAEIKREAIRLVDPIKKRSEWRWYYDFMGLYSDINYNYAITTHKSQGSSYCNCFVLEDDIDQNKKIIERNRIKYTAFTRASDKLFVIHKA